MTKFILLMGILLVPPVVKAQQTDWSTEFQSEFIDISGLFGLREPAQVTTLQYNNHGFFADGFHSFSWKEPGKVVQTFFGAGYRFTIDSSKSIAVKNDFAFNRVANNGSFLRPMVIGRWALDSRQIFYFAAWVFLDTRRETIQPLNGGTSYLGYAYRMPLKTFTIRNEIRLLYSHVANIRDVGGITHQVKVSTLTQLYVIANVGYSFYRSDGGSEVIWNIGFGKAF